MKQITPQDLRQAFLDGLATGNYCTSTLDGRLDNPSFHAQAVAFDELLTNDVKDSTTLAAWRRYAAAKYAEQPVRIPALLTYSGVEYGWVNGGLYSRRAIDADSEPQFVPQLPSNADLVQKLAPLIDQTLLVPHSPENVLWANLLVE